MTLSFMRNILCLGITNLINTTIVYNSCSGGMGGVLLFLFRVPLLMKMSLFSPGFYY